MPGHIEMEDNSHNKILKLLEEKVLLKQEVFGSTKSVFDELKKSLNKIADDLKLSVKNISKELSIEFKDTGDYECQFILGDETLVFVMHTNIFTFDNSHEIWRQKYVQQDNRRSYCGKIFIYNFLYDSFHYNRINDVGYLIARIFINRERHFFVEGKKQIENLYNDFSTTILDSENILKIIESSILYSLDFDLFTPPFESIQNISVKDIMDSSLQSRIATGKRLGFAFENEGKIDL